MKLIKYNNQEIKKYNNTLESLIRRKIKIPNRLTKKDK